ncbi:hypothetical protein C8J56DRAFT_1047557 [Mycena floridula]|nr:hypothetical protein C8J56DRAFT_1047557 [Mycena floridula]
MVRSTIIVRASDALPLAASVDDEQTEQALQEHKQQSKLIFRRITPNSEPRCSIESGQYTLHYLISDNVVFLTIADKSYPRKLAFSYLDELSKEFATTYGPKVEAVRKPYAFVGFDTFMSKTARLYRDTRTASAAAGSGLDRLNDDLQDVTRIMTKNMEELLWRGDSLDRMSHLSTSLRSESEKYRKAARNINLQAMLRTICTSGRRSSIQAYPQAAPAQPSTANQILPGSITYTTSTGPDGSILYHPFKAVAASYQTPSGLVSGIQWVPAEAQNVIPAGAQPATTNFAESWRKDDQKSIKDCDMRTSGDERKKRNQPSCFETRKEVDTTPTLSLGWLEKRDAATRERRGSFNQGTSPLIGGQPVMPGGYPAFPNYPAPGTAQAMPQGYTRDRRYSSTGGTMGELDRQFNDMGLERDREYGERERKVSIGRPKPYGGPETERTRKISGNYGTSYGAPVASYGTPAVAPYAVGGYGSGPTSGGTVPFVPPLAGVPGDPYARSSSPMPYGANPNPRSSSPMPYGANQNPRSSSPMPYGAPNMRSTSPMPYGGPNMRSTSPMPYGGPNMRSTSPMPYGGNPNVYPPGHVLEGKPIPHSRSTTPLPGAMGPPVGFPSSGGPMQFPQPTLGSSPRVPGPGQQLAAPAGFMRPINAAQPYTPFETMKVQDMDDFLDTIPGMPLVLRPHDVYTEDWTRLMEDLSLAWSDRLPVPSLTNSGRPPKRATLTADLVDLWNTSFFIRRGIELVLYKGRERRSGANAGVADLPKHLAEAEYVSSSSEEDSDSEDDDPASTYGYYKPPSVPGSRGMAEVIELRRRRNEFRAEKKRRRQERKLRRKEKARERKYSLYLTCVRPGGPQGNSPYPSYMSEHR